MGSAATILWGLWFGSIGFAYCMYGRKQKRAVPLVCGVVLMIFPYFVNNVVLLAAIGTGVSVIPYFYRY